MWAFLAKKAITKRGARYAGVVGRTNRNNEYRAPAQYTNYHIHPVWIRRRYTKPYKANMHAYSLPFHYSRAGPAYQRSRRTRNFWRWR